MKKEQPLTSLCIFGGCPSCGRSEHRLDLGFDQWSYCRRHRVRWLSARIMEPPSEEDQTQWLANAKILADCEIIEPAFPYTHRWSRMRLGFLLGRFLDAVFPRRRIRRFQIHGSAPLLEIWSADLVPIPDRIKWELWHIIDHYIGGEIERDGLEDDQVEAEARHRFLLSIRRWLVTYLGR